DAPNGRVLAIDPEQPARANWKSVIPQGRDAIDLGGTSVTLVDHQLIVRTVHDAHSRVMTYGLDGTPRREISLPGAGTAAVFDDFIAAAEWLIARHYTSVHRLAIHGRSNGGLLIGACLTQRPELFGAAIAQVGVLDMLRFNRFGQGAGWEGDYGSPEDPREF